MKVLLIYPEFPDTFWSFKHALEFVGKRAALPPEWPTRLVDTNVRKLTQKDLAWADCAFISAMVCRFSRGCPFNCDFCNITALRPLVLDGRVTPHSRGPALSVVYK